jgi:hypothetical protein
MCFDKRVVAGLALAGIGALVFVPNLLAAALPLLLVAICPLSMLFMLLMGKAMMGGPRQQTNESLLGSTSAVLIDVPYSVGPAPDSTAQAATLRPQLRELQKQQAELAKQIARLEASEASSNRDTALPLDRVATS